MKKRGFPLNRPLVMVPPAWPFPGTDLFGDLRARLTKTTGRPLSLGEIAKLMGQAKSTTHFWCSEYRHPQVLGLLALLERLSPVERQSFIATHCRELPTLADPKLSGATKELRALLDQRTGLSVITGSTDAERSFVLTALGHSGGARLSLTGIDLHCPRTWVPVVGLRYIDERQAANEIRALVTSVWPRILTCSAKLALFNDLLTVVPEVLNDVLRMAARKHVILAEPHLPDFSTRSDRSSVSVQVLTLEKDEHHGISVKCRAGRPGRRN